MAKRKKLKKAGSATRNIHKLATTIGIVPLVAMSSFLFHDSYALAAAPVIPSPNGNITLELFSGMDKITITADSLYGSGSTYSLTGAVSVSPSIGLSVPSETYGSVLLTGHAPGTYLVTIPVQHDAQYDTTTVKVVVIDRAITSDALDTGHNGLDIADIVSAINNQTAAADINGDGSVNESDLTKLLQFIPPSFSNHSPYAIKSIADRNILTEHEIAPINLDSYFSDQDGDHLNYHFYTYGTSVSAYVTGDMFGDTFLNFSQSNTTGSTNFVVVADDFNGGSKVMEFDVNVRPSFGTGSVTNQTPTVVWNQATELAISDESRLDMELMFADPDSDKLNYNLAGDSADFFYAYFPSNQLDLSYTSSQSGFASGRHLLTITAHDTASSATTVTSSVYAEVINEDIIIEDEMTQIDLTSFIEGTDSHSIVPSTVSFPHATSSLSSDGTSLNIAGISEGTYTVTIGATTGGITKYKTFILPVYHMGE